MLRVKLEYVRDGDSRFLPYSAVAEDPVARQVRIGKILLPGQATSLAEACILPVYTTFPVRRFPFMAWMRGLNHSQGRIKVQGAIDIQEVREEIAAVMEGGREAFTLRKEKYGF